LHAADAAAININMSNHQVLMRLPEDVVRRLKRQVPARERSRFVAGLLDRALPPDSDDPLHQAALAVERDRGLAEEMAEWDATAADGLDSPTATPPER